MKIQLECNFKMAIISRFGRLAILAAALGILYFGAGPVAAVHLTSGNGEDIQRALDGAASNEAVTLGAGVFVVSTPIFLSRNGQTLRGSGTNTVLVLAEKANCPVIILGAPLDPACRTVRDLEVANLMIDGNRIHQQVELWRSAVDGCQLNNNGINVWNVTDVKVSKVTAARCRSGGVVTAAGVRRLTLEFFECFDSEFDGVACYQTEESRFTDLFLHDNRAAGISLDLAFNNNVIERAILTRNDLGVFMRESRRNVFRELTIQDSRKHGVFVAQRAELTAKGWQYVADTECTDNLFESMTVRNIGGKPYWVNDVSCTNNRFPEELAPQPARPALIKVAAEAVATKTAIDGDE
jgi:nitrous oxidase accessory protein NosD